MSEVPDKVIEQATLRLDRAAHRQTCAVHGYSGEPMRDPEGNVMWSLKAGVLAAAPVIARWAREQERERIASRVRAELIPESEHDGSPAGPLGDSITDQTGTIDLGDCLTVDIAEGIARWIEALDRDGSDTRRAAIAEAMRLGDSRG